MRAIDASGISTSGPTGSSRSGSSTEKRERSAPSRMKSFITRLPSESASRLLYGRGRGSSRLATRLHSASSLWHQEP